MFSSLSSPPVFLLLMTSPKFNTLKLACQRGVGAEGSGESSKEKEKKM